MECSLGWKHRPYSSTFKILDPNSDNPDPFKYSHSSDWGKWLRLENTIHYIGPIKQAITINNGKHLWNNGMFI